MAKKNKGNRKQLKNYNTDILERKSISNSTLGGTGNIESDAPANPFPKKGDPVN